MIWKKVQVKDISKIVYGRGLPKKTRSNKGSVPVYGSGGQIGLHCESLVKHSTLILARKGSIGNTFRVKEPSWPIDTVYYLNDIEIDLDYLFYYLNLQKFKNTATTIPSLRREDLEAIEVRYPKEQDDQKTVVVAIETQFTRLDAAIKSLKAIKDKLGVYRKSVLKAAFTGKLFKLLHEWENIKLGEVLKVKSGDGLYKANRDEKGEHFVYGGNGVTGRHSKYMFEEPQLIIGRVGVYCGNVHITKTKSWVTDNAFVVDFDNSMARLNFLFYYLTFLRLNKYSSSTAQPVISGRKIYPIPIKLPIKEEQNLIVNEIESRFSIIDKVGEVVDKSLKKAERLRRSILKFAFEGKFT